VQGHVRHAFDFILDRGRAIQATPSIHLHTCELDDLRPSFGVFYPGLGRLAIMGHVGNPIIVLELGELQAAARTMGIEVDTLEIRRPQDIAPALAGVKGRANALYVCQDLLTLGSRLRINPLALGARVPVIHASREHIEAAGLMSYGPNFLDLHRRAGDYVDDRECAWQHMPMA
jgi:hypothetical protein